MNEISERIEQIRERTEAATERTEWQVGVSYDEGWPVYRLVAMDPPVEKNAQIVRRFIQESASDVPFLLSLVEDMRDQLCKYTCECGPASNPDPTEHADYCLYRSALRDAALEADD